MPKYQKDNIWFLVKYGDSLISWKSKKQTTMSRSSVEAEYRSMGSEVAEVVWLTTLMKELGDGIEMHVEVYSDSKTALQIVANSVFHEKTKHIEIDCHFIRQKIQEGLVKTKHVGTKDQTVDILTKELPRAHHEYLVGKLGMLNIFAPASLRGSEEMGID